MIINCECGEKKFNVDSNLIPKEGRLLKCGSCSKIWHYTPIIETKNDEDLDVKINESVVKNELQSDEAINDNKFKDISEEVLSEENTDHDEKEENNIKEENKNEEKQGKIKMVLVYFVVVIISLLGLILLLDTFKSYLISEFPTITPLFDSFYETFLDFKLFVKDLAN
ncbi:zinc-ribbon domain-containing protein [Candidatus Pelagibacter sp.]|nr:zinc-ribbon domain-containing protein [Candidatus Pelagibacter sp.]